jgi:hypothetical protein
MHQTRRTYHDTYTAPMRNNVIVPAKQLFYQYGDEAYAKAREAQLTALRERRSQLAAFYGKVAEKIKELSARQRR